MPLQFPVRLRFKHFGCAHLTLSILPGHVLLPQPLQSLGFQPLLPEGIGKLEGVEEEHE